LGGGFGVDLAAAVAPRKRGSAGPLIRSPWARIRSSPVSIWRRLQCGMGFLLSYAGSCCWFRWGFEGRSFWSFHRWWRSLGHSRLGSHAAGATYHGLGGGMSSSHHAGESLPSSVLGQQQRRLRVSLPS
jgi:hypothetical protein